ncbi:MAG TPA: YhjD/YihY/BrkB family envelope integrity protein, partial [Chitinophagaceae bacterium]
MKKLKTIWKVTVESFKSFIRDKIPKYSASLAYTTVFSLGPLLIVIIFLCSLFFGQEATEGRIYEQMQQFVG